MKTSTTLAMALALVSICVLLAAGILALSLTKELRILRLLMVSVAIGGSLLVLYLDWRGKLLRRVLNEREERQDLDTAA